MIANILCLLGIIGTVAVLLFFGLFLAAFFYLAVVLGVFVWETT